MVTELEVQKNEILSSDYAESYKKIMMELNEVQSGLNGKERIEGLGGILTEELRKALDPDMEKALKDAFQRVKNDPELSSKAGKGLKAVELFLEPDRAKEQKFENNQNENYKEFMEKLRNPESLSRMTRGEIDMVKLYLEDKTHEQDAYRMYEEIRKNVIDENRLQSLKGQDKEFTNEILACLKENYGKSDFFFEKIYGAPQPTKNFLKKFSLGDWQGEDAKLGGNPGQDSRFFRGSDILDREYLMEKFNKMNQLRIKNNEDTVKNFMRIKNISAKMLVDNESRFKMGDNGLMFDDEQFTFEGFESKFRDEIIAKIRVMSAKKEVDFAHESEAQKTYEKCKKEIYDNMVSDIKKYLNQKQTNDLLGGNSLGDELKGVKDYNNFIEKDTQDNVTFHPEKAREYLKIKFLREGNGVADISWPELKGKLGTAEGKAWIAAVQVLLNSNMPDDPIPVNGEFKDGDITFQRVKKFQEQQKFVASGKREDGRPGPITMRALLGVQETKEQTQKDKEMADKVETTLTPYECKSDEMQMYNIPEGVPTFKTKGLDGTSETADLNAIFYRKDNKIYRVGFDKPWVRSESVFANGNALNAPILINEELNVYEGGAKKLTEIIQKLDKDLSVVAVDGKYQLKNGEKVVIAIDPADKVLFAKEGFCGKKDILDRIKLIALASQVKEKFAGRENDLKFNGVGIEIEGSGDIIPTVDLGYGIDLSNADDFIDYCKKLNNVDGVYTYNSEEVNNTVVVGKDSSNNAVGTRVNTPQRKPGQAVRGNAPGQLEKPVDNPDPDGIAVFGYKKLKNEPAGLRQRYGIPTTAKCVYDVGPRHTSNTCYFYVDHGRIYKIYKSEPYLRQEMDRNEHGTSKGEPSINVCNAGAEILKNKVKDFPEVSVIAENGKYSIKTRNFELDINGKMFDSTPWCGMTTCYQKINCIALSLQCKELQKALNLGNIYYISGKLGGYDKWNYFNYIKDVSWTGYVYRNGGMTTFLNWVNSIK